MSWEDYNHNCNSCYQSYMKNPPGDPCYSHKGKPGNEPSAQGPEEYQKVFGAPAWREDEPAYDFAADPFLSNRLGFLKFIWDSQSAASH
jgi:hypothetical protein